MLNSIIALLRNEAVGYWQSIIGAVVCVFLFYLLFQKNSRDERGRAIIGKASVISTIYFIVITTVMAQVSTRFIPLNQFNVDIYINVIQFIFNTFIIVEIISILIIRKLQ